MYILDICLSIEYIPYGIHTMHYMHIILCLYFLKRCLLMGIKLRWFDDSVFNGFFPYDQDSVFLVNRGLVVICLPLVILWYSTGSHIKPKYFRVASLAVGQMDDMVNIPKHIHNQNLKISLMRLDWCFQYVVIWLCFTLCSSRILASVITGHFSKM